MPAVCHRQAGHRCSQLRDAGEILSDLGPEAYSEGKSLCVFRRQIAFITGSHHALRCVLNSRTVSGAISLSSTHALSN